VGVPPSHPLHGKDYMDDSVPDDVHGGLTFAAECHKADAPCRGICHIPAPGEPEHLWWFGFDCAHGGDIMPVHHLPNFGGETYRAVPYVKAEVASLARQLAACV
jgi:hypothetical protein